MIFVTIGTHPGQFTRLVKHIDEIAPQLNEKIIIQRGFTQYNPKNVEYFDFAPSLEPYYEKARLVISHSATSLLEFIIHHKKPIITVPRQKKYREHINDHQVEFAEALEKRTGIKAVLDISEITPQLLKSYKHIAKIDERNINQLRTFFKKEIDEFLISPKPFAFNRIDYVCNLIDPRKDQKVLNVGISNIPEIEIKIESQVKGCWTIDLDKQKLDDARTYLKKTKLVYGDVTSTDLPANYFDTIVVLEVFEHLKNDKETMKKLIGLLKKSGKIIFSVPNNHPLHIINPVKYTQHERHYSNDRAKRLAEENGLIINHFNLVENWKLLANLYRHLFFKYLLGKKVQFTYFDATGNKTYSRFNSRGMDIVICALKK